MILASDYLEWKANPVTKQFFVILRNRIYDLQTRLVGETLTGEGYPPAATAGAVRALEEILEKDYEDFTYGN